MLGGLRAGELLRLLRDARRGAAARRPLAVDGMLAAELARALSAGGDAMLVRTGADPSGAAAYVLVLAGAASADEVRRLRRAARAVVPTVVVQTRPGAAGRVPYVLPGAVVDCPPGEGFPVERIASVLGELLDAGAVPLAAGLPALRPGLLARHVRRSALRAALVGALPAKRSHFPLLALVQYRLVLDVAAAYGREPGPATAPDLAAVTGAGLAARRLARSLPLGGKPVAALTGYGVTRTVGEAAVALNERARPR